MPKLAAIRGIPHLKSFMRVSVMVYEVTNVDIGFRDLVLLGELIKRIAAL